MTRKLNFIDTGVGNRTLVFLHHFGGSSRTWLPVIHELKQTSRCIAVDLPGFGDSRDSSDNFSVYSSAEKLTALIETLDLGKFVLIAHSMGAKIGLVVASQKKFHIEKIVLVAPSPPSPEPMSEKDRNTLLAGFQNRPLIEEIISDITYMKVSDAIHHSLVDDYFRIEEKAWTAWLLDGSKENIDLPESDIPALIVSGKYDKNLSTLFLRTTMTKYFSLAAFKQMDHAAHLIPVDAPAELAGLIGLELEQSI